jgi:hypothetical protein
VGDAVTSRLEPELGDRGLLLGGDDFAASEVNVAQRGPLLLTSQIHRCYPITRHERSNVALDFASERGANRLKGALAEIIQVALIIHVGADAVGLLVDLSRYAAEILCAEALPQGRNLRTSLVAESAAQPNDQHRPAVLEARHERALHVRYCSALPSWIKDLRKS